MRALDDLVRDGKVRAIGCSNFSAAAGVRRARHVGATSALAAFVTCQDEYSLLVRKHRARPGAADAASAA